MMKLAVFDLDGTLAELGRGILPRDIELLKEIENAGVRIAICSGKPVYYLCGFMRQVGLKRPILIGENGAVIQFGVDLPPKDYYVLPYSNEAKKSIHFLKDKISEELPGIWYQPNEVGLTPFPKSEEEFEKIVSILDRYENEIQEVDVYRHVDSFDITPKGIDKKAGLEYLGQLLGISALDMISVGDGVNDYPMFEYTGLAFGIHVKEEEKVDKNFQTITEALRALLKSTR